MKRLLKKCMMMLVIMAILVLQVIPVSAANTKTEYKVRVVKVRANLRETPSGRGKWILTVPQGAFVVQKGEEPENSYMLIEYGEYEGYIYAGCLKETDDCTYDNYKEQFPELFEDKVDNQKPASGSPEPQKPGSPEPQKPGSTEPQKPGSPEPQKPDATDTKPSATEEPQKIDKKDETVISDSNKPEAIIDSKTDNVVADEIAASTEGVKESTETPRTDGVAPLVIGNDFENAESTLLGSGGSVSTSETNNRESTIEAQVLILAKLRSLPTAESEKVASVPVGEKVEIIDGGDNGYTHVKYDGTEGYIYSRCISYDQELLGEGGGVIDTLVVDELQNKSEKASSGVYEAKYSSNFLKRHIIAANASAAMTGGVEDAEENLAENDVEVEIPKNNKSTSVINDVASNVIGRKANLRSLPDKDSNRIATINVGADVTVLGASEGGYTMVQYNGVIGYVLEDCVVDHIEVADIVQISGGDPIMFSVTAYCSCKKCCGSYSPEVRGGEAHTATGTVPAEGRTIAVDPSVIPYGTRVYIDGYGTFIAEDCGGAVKGNHIDMYFDTHEGAVAFGSKRLFVTIEQ